MNTKLLIVFFLLLALVTAGSYLGYQWFTQKQAQANQTKTLPFTNPFAEKPSSSFTATPAFENPFTATPTSTYQNPFATTDSGDQTYTNPFEQLR